MPVARRSAKRPLLLNRKTIRIPKSLKPGVARPRLFCWAGEKAAAQALFDASVSFDLVGEVGEVAFFAKADETFGEAF
jgi:hypothetical protein